MSENQTPSSVKPANMWTPFCSFTPTSPSSSTLTLTISTISEHWTTSSVLSISSPCKPAGLLVVNGDDPNVKKTLEGITHAKIVTFGLGAENMYSAANVRDEAKACEDFTILKQGIPLCEAKLSIPGRPQYSQRACAAAVADQMGIAPGNHCPTRSMRSMASTAALRSLESSEESPSRTIFAHHPTELTATLSAAMRMGVS